MKRFWRRVLAGAMTAILAVSLLPAPALAALWDNSSDYNQEILDELRALCGSEDEARYYYDLLEEYGLLEESGSLFSAWDGVITLQEDARPLTLPEVRAMDSGTVTVNGRACDVSALNAALDGLEGLGLLAGNVPVSDWQLRLDGAAVAPGGLSAALATWQPPAPPQEPAGEPEDTPGSTEETSEPPESSSGDGVPSDAQEAPAESSGAGGAEPARMSALSSQTAPAVTVLGGLADTAALGEVITFLDQYGLLTDTGCLTDWDLTLPGGERELTSEELLAMVEAGQLADDAVAYVDGTSVTVADLKVMLAIEDEIAYLREKYFDGQEWTQEQLDNLNDFIDQAQNQGILFLPEEPAVSWPSDLEAMDEVSDEEWPRGVRQDVYVTVDTPLIEKIPASNKEFIEDWQDFIYTVTLRLNKPQTRDVKIKYTFYRGSLLLHEAGRPNADGTNVIRSGAEMVSYPCTIPAGSTEVTIPVSMIPWMERNTVTGNYTGKAKQEQNGPGCISLQLEVTSGNAAFADNASTKCFRPIYAALGAAEATEESPWKGMDWKNYTEVNNASWAYDIWTPNQTFHMGDLIPIRLYSHHPLAIGFDQDESTMPALTVYTEGTKDSPQTLYPIESTVCGEPAETGKSASFGYCATYLYEVGEKDRGSLTVAKNNLTFTGICSYDAEDWAAEINQYLENNSSKTEIYNAFQALREFWGEGPPVTEELLAKTAEEVEGVNAASLTKYRQLKPGTFTVQSTVEAIEALTPDMKKAAFKSIRTEIVQDEVHTADSIMNIYLELADDPELVQWVTDASGEQVGTDFFTDPDQLGLSIDGGTTMRPFLYPNDPATGQPYSDLAGKTLTAAFMLPTPELVDPYEVQSEQESIGNKRKYKEAWWNDKRWRPVYDAFCQIAELYVDGKAAYGYAGCGVQPQGRFIDPRDFDVYAELVHTDGDKNGQAYTPEEYSLEGPAPIDRMAPWIKEMCVPINVSNTDIKFTIRPKTGDDLAFPDNQNFLYADAAKLTGFQLAEDWEESIRYGKAYQISEDIPLTQNINKDKEKDKWNGLVGISPDDDYSLRKGGHAWACTLIPLDPDADFAIWSSDPSVAEVRSDGSIWWKKSGPVVFEIYALNGMTEPYLQGDGWSAVSDVASAKSIQAMGLRIYNTPGLTLPAFPVPTDLQWELNKDKWNRPDSEGKPTTWWDLFEPISYAYFYINEENTQTLKGMWDYNVFKGYYVSMGSEPFLTMPNPDMEAPSGQKLNVYWSTNLCELSGEDVTFTVTTTDKSGRIVGTPVTVTGNQANPVSSAEINAPFFNYGEGADNTYVVTVTATYQGTEYTAQGGITVSAQPATVRLAELDSYYITDETSSVPISWELSNFGDESTEGQREFELKITRGGVEVRTQTSPGTFANDVWRGSVNLPVRTVPMKEEDPNSFRDVYTVTVRAMAGQDNTWSNDSFLLYVYSKDALDIRVDGKPTDGTLRVSNEEEISRMYQENPGEIIKLNRDIQLKNMISANYNERAWNALADQIIWQSGDSDVASINYQEGSYYSDIETFPYISYRPTTDFGILGRQNGQTTITATHKVTGLEENVAVTVNTLKDKLYLFQFYPQEATTLVFTTGKGEIKYITSDKNGAAAVYLPASEGGIAGNVYCYSKGYRGTIYVENLRSGEGDWTRLERYPCNNLTLRPSDYTYVYLKNANGTPYKNAEVKFRGGIYLNGRYQQEEGDGLFFLQGATVPKRGDEGVTVTTDKWGRLYIKMDQTLLSEGALQSGTKVTYILQLTPMKGGEEDTSLYPVFARIDGSANRNETISTGSATVTFRKNSDKSGKKHPFIALQVATQGGGVRDVTTETGFVGISDDLASGTLTTSVMWWNGLEDGVEPGLQLETTSSRKFREGQISTETYPFTDCAVTDYTVRLTEETLKGVVSRGEASPVRLNYYKNGKIVYQETLPFKLSNLRGVGQAANSPSLLTEVQSMGRAFATSGSSMDTGDKYVNKALSFIAGGSYTKSNSKAFQMKLAPTEDPTRFMALISVSLGSLNDADQVTGVYGQSSTGARDLDYAPGFRELMTLAGRKSVLQYGGEVLDEFARAKARSGINDKEWGVKGYMEGMVFYDFNAKSWKVQILNGGFNAGGGMSRSWHVNAWAGIIPFTATLTMGATGQVSMDALAVAYYNSHSKTYGIGNDFLTQLRIYMYVRFFAGIGFDYSVLAFKLGVFGQVNVDMVFQWLNRPYMGSGIQNVADGSWNTSKYSGQNFKITGQIGLELYFKLLFFKIEKILCSKSFNFLDRSTGQWNTIQTNWSKNQKANQGVIDSMLRNGSASLYSMGGQEMFALNLATTLEDRTYLENGRSWGSGFSLFSLDPVEEQGLTTLEYNTYPYANPLVSDDGELVVYLHDMDRPLAEDTRVKFSTRSGGSYAEGKAIPVPSDEAAAGDVEGNAEGNAKKGGYGDSQLSFSGTKDMAVAAWTRQMTSLQKTPITYGDYGLPVYGYYDDGTPIYDPVLTEDDQTMMMNGTEIYASVYNGSQWTTTRLTENSGADMAPVAASNGDTAVVAWRSVAASGEAVGESGAAGIATFDRRDNILYRVYKGGQWGDVQTLYNGTSGAVKGIVADMMPDGTAAVAYTLDTDSSDATATDREIVYAVIGADSGDVRTVRATTDAYLDENPQLTSVKFGGEERFVLGWYTEQSVSSDGAAALDGGTGGGSDISDQAVSDIRLLEFGRDGETGQLLPDSIDQIASDYDVSITSNFRFTKNSDTISDLSILWVERANEVTASDEENGGSGTAQPDALLVERDVLKGVKFYTYGQNNDLISFTAAVDVADMSADWLNGGTLIDHFDAYVSDPPKNEIKAVILGTTYNAENPVKRVAQAEGGEIVSFYVPAKHTSMFTATETYMDKIEVPDFLPDYDTIQPGASTQIQFTVENRGIHAVSGIDITVGGQQTHYDDLDLLPGSSIQLYADYIVPNDKVVDPAYRVEAVFDENSGAAGTAETGGSEGALFGLLGARDGFNVVSGTIYLDLTDVGITTDPKVVDAVDGLRTVQLGLYNAQAAELAGSGRTVQLSFFSDAAYSDPIAAKYFAGGSGEDGYILTISDADDLESIDMGGYATQFTFKVGEYIQSEDGAVKEIPDGGVTVYIKAEVLDADGAVQGEPNAKNNRSSITCTSLKANAEKDVILTPSVSVEDGTAAVTVDLQNARLASTATGNLTVILRNADGSILASQQSYDAAAPDKGLITLHGEERRSGITFTFEDVDLEDVAVQVEYSDLVIEQPGTAAPNTELGSLFCEGLLAGLDSVTWAETSAGVYEAAVTTGGRTSSVVTAAAKSPNAAVSITGAADVSPAGGSLTSGTVSLGDDGTGTITITVTNGGQSSTYILTVSQGNVPVDGVRLDKTSLNLTAGETAQLTAAVHPDTATNKTVTWTSGDSSVVEVDQSGEVTAVGEGTAIITVTTADGSFTASCTVTVKAASAPSIPVTGVNLSESSVYLAAGETKKLIASIEPADATSKGLTWTSSDTGVAAVDSSGTVTAVGEGTATITVTTANGGKTATCVVTVTSTQMKVEIKQGITELPEAFRTLPDLNTVEKVTAAMRTAITQLGIPSENTAVYDVTLMVNDGSGWKKADAGNFPAGGLTVTLPYPQGTDSSYRFTVVHMFTTSDFGKTPGATETPSVTNTADGIRFTVRGLSPISVGWTAPEPGKPTEPEKPVNPNRPGTGGSSSYPVSIENAEHGKVTASPSHAGSGSTVTLTVAPEDGYVLHTLTVTDSRGNEVRLSSRGGGRYTFTMPAGPVSVGAVFAPLPGDGETPCDGGAACPSRRFADLGGVGTWYHEAVDYVLRNHLMDGYSSGLFGPDNSLTRAQLAQILYNREGRPAVTGSSIFPDVAAGQWYTSSVIWANQNGIVGGYSSGIFGPNDNITREQLAVMLWRCSRSPAATRRELHFSDADEISGYALDAVGWAVESGILNGYSDGHLAPKGLATRAQVAQMLKNYMESLEDNS